MEYIKTYEQFLNEMAMHIDTKKPIVFKSDFGKTYDPVSLMDQMFSRKGLIANATFVSPLTFENKKLTKTVTDRTTGEKIPNPMVQYVSVTGADGTVREYPKLYKKTDYLFRVGQDYKKAREKEYAKNGETFASSGRYTGKHHVDGWENILKQSDKDNNIYYLVMELGQRKPESKFMLYIESTGKYEVVDYATVEPYLPPRKPSTWSQPGQSGEDKELHVEPMLNNILVIRSEKVYYYNLSLLEGVPMDVKNIITKDIEKK